MEGSSITQIRESGKRKRQDESLLLQLSTQTADSICPILVSYPALQALPSTTFRCYSRKRSKTKTKNKEEKEEDAGDLDQQDLLVVGETDSVEFVSNEEESRKAANAGCRYLVAVHNRRESTLTLLPMAKSPHILTHTVKALKSILPSAEPSALQYREAKNALGETFGTKKAKANIRAQERNRVDVSAMAGVMDFVMEGIEKGVSGLMTQEEAKTTADNNRLIPSFSATATDPTDVYPLHDIIPEVEWKAISVSAFDQATIDKEWIAVLPFRWSSWVNSHLKAVMEETEKTKKRNMSKILFYISAMLAFRKIAERNKLEKDNINEQLVGVPAIIVDSLLARFSEVPRGSTSHTSTLATQTSLLTHMFALCLKVDNFATDTSVLAKDLGKAISWVNDLFKTLGCKIVTLNEKERSRLGLPGTATGTKRAVLNAPVVFPKPKMKKKA